MSPGSSYSTRQGTIGGSPAIPWPDPLDPGYTAGLREEAQALHERTSYAVEASGGFVLAAVHSIQPNVPPENILSMAAAARRMERTRCNDPEEPECQVWGIRRKRHQRLLGPAAPLGGHVQIAPAPLFRDPIYDGAADPVIIWNRQEQAWWLLYSCRRANVDVRGAAFFHGTDIGIASSSNEGRSWVYRGTLQGLEFERGRNTFWAPEVIEYQGTYHMYVSYVRGTPHDWSSDASIVHMVSDNLWDWRFVSRLQLSSSSVIDACVLRLPDGRWRMWYKDGPNGSHTFAADSPDLYEWSVLGSVIDDCPHEGPNVFFWRGHYWMITDPWQGLGVYRSEECEQWVRQPNILDRPGSRTDDGVKGSHADVLVQGEEAYIFYHVHPGGHVPWNKWRDSVVPYEHRRTSLQVARLQYAAGQLLCDRDAAFEFRLQPPVG